MKHKEFKNRYAGERIFVIGNGPSLKDTSLELIDDEYSVAMNRVDEIYSTTSWRPDFYLQINSYPRREIEVKSVKKHIKMGIPCFINEDLCSYFGEKENIHYLEREKVNRDQVKKISDNKLNDVDESDISVVWSNNIYNNVKLHATSVHVAAQIANYMGFDELYFVGCDLYPIFILERKFPKLLFEGGKNPYQNTDVINGKEDYVKYVLDSKKPLRTLLNGIWYKFRPKLVKSTYEATLKLNISKYSHFSKNYKPTRIFKTERNNRLIDVHQMIKCIGELKGFQTFNATNGGDLEVYQRVMLENV